LHLLCFFAQSNWGIKPVFLYHVSPFG